MAVLTVIQLANSTSLQAKREIAKKEGRLLTKKQKEEQRIAELRKQALLASGVQIEGLQHNSAAPAPKKVVYGNRKKKGPAGGVATSSGPTTRDPSPVREATPPAPEPPSPADEPATKADVKDDWDASSGDEGEKVKDSWDASSDEEEEKPAVPSKCPFVR